MGLYINTASDTRSGNHQAACSFFDAYQLILGKYENSIRSVLEEVYRQNIY